MTPEHIRTFYTCRVTKAPHDWRENLAGDVSCSRCYLCFSSLGGARHINTLLQASVAPKEKT